MINKKIEEAINNQINAEIYSAYLYLSMSAYFQNRGLKGFAHWMEVQTAEEFGHARKFYTYLFDRGGRVLMKPIEGPATDWKSPENVFEEVLKHEQKVTGLINELVNLAIAEKDHASNAMLQWFVTEQVEEEASALEILDELKLIGNDGNGLLMKDRELGGRALNPLLFAGLAGPATA
ncbi:MAG: ferritin [Spirochaetes bacterium RBG_13_51_14]|nr:MAG: ferritin [Spirochaetes bacterium RBG_13_51_14]